MRRLRTFIAVDASPSMRKSAQKLAAQLMTAAGDVKWVAPENLHWTLQFLGEVDELEIPSLCAAVSSAVATIDCFDLEAHGAGAFPAPDRPRTLWLGAGKGEQAMVALHTAIQKKLDQLGYRGETRRFVPHLTLGRAGKGPPRTLVRELAALAEYDGGSMLVDEVTIYSSRLGADGPSYSVLAHASLA